MLVECLRGVEEPEPEPQPAEEATSETTGEGGCARSSHTPGEETTELSALGRFKLPPPPAFVFNPDLLHTAKPFSLALPSSTLSVASTPLLRTPIRTPARTPIPTRPTTPILVPVQLPVQLKIPKKPLPPPPPRERKLTDEWTLSMHWPMGYSWPPAEIEDVFPVGEVVREVYN